MPTGETPSIDPALEAAPEHLATVKWYSLAKGYGFVDADELTDDVFIHHTELVGGEDLREGDRVRLRLFDTPRGLLGRRVERTDADPS